MMGRERGPASPPFGGRRRERRPNVGTTLGVRDMAANQVVWIDGKWVAAAEARVSVYDHGLLYGDGVFEGIRLYNGKFLKLQTHLRRLWDSARSIALQIPYPAEALTKAIRETAVKNGLQDGYVRLVVTR